MKNISTKLAAVAFVLLAAGPALAGQGGSASLIRSAVQSGSVDAIIAEVERAESLKCSECVQLVTNMLEDDRYEVREVAGWWFARRANLRDMMIPDFIADLQTGTTVQVRNAADFLGATVSYTALPALRAAITRTDVGVDGKVAMVRAVKELGHKDGNPVLVSAMADASPVVRAAAVTAWRDIRGQVSAAPVAALLTDADAKVRAEAATVVGAMTHTASAATLEVMLLSDRDLYVRRNAAWALGKLGQSSSRPALTVAATDASGLVRGYAKAALATLR